MKQAISYLWILTIAMTLSCKGETNNTVSEDFAITMVDTKKPTKKHYIKVALLLDTSNSMDGLIDQAKAQLWEMVNELSYARCQNQQPNLQIALYEYGNDNLAGSEGYIRQVLNFTEDLDEISKELFSLTTNGGSEFCGHVIQTSLNQLAWGKNADDLKMVFIAGNEPFTQGQVDYKDAAANAKEQGVVVNTIFCGNYDQGISGNWKDGAELTYGDYMAIDQNQRTVHIASPYDDLILQLNLRLNKTYVYYGSAGSGKAQEQVAQDSNASTYGESNAVSRTVSKASGLYKNASWDLVDAMDSDEEFELDEIEEAYLPKELQGKTNKEIEAYVKKQKTIRDEIQSEIQKLNEKRRQFIADKKKDTNNGLEDAMVGALKKQAAKKNYTWNNN